MDIRLLDGVVANLKALKELLADCVASGASIGFLPPLQEMDATQFWLNVGEGVQTKSRLLFAVFNDEKIVGTVQLAMVQKPNGRHRGEVEKLMVHTTARGKGIGRMLMAELERVAEDNGISLLVLDTRLGDVASHLYRKLGFVEAGQIPNFVTNAKGEFESTVFFYKLI